MARVHLVIYAQMTGQTWSHLILTGLNEGVWPRVFEAGAFGSRHEFVALNQQARILNRRESGPGGQGMGHETVGTDRGHCLLPLEQRDLALRDLCAVLESTGVAACLAAMTTVGGQSLLPSDFFNHAYQAQTERALDEETFRAMANTTATWCGEQEFLIRSTPPASISTITATQIAYAARRDATQPFGPYEFAYAQPPKRPIQLSCKRWEDAWNHPSIVWLEEVLGASSWPDGTLSWSRAVGTWVHRWLATSLRECRECNSTKDILLKLLEAAHTDALQIRNRAHATGIELYPWWDEVWGQARDVARSLAEIVAPHLEDRQFLSEFRLPSNVMIVLPGSDCADFLLKGRVDLLLVEPGAVPQNLSEGDFSGCNCWVVDFKTGTAQTLTGKKIGEGKGLQALLYALAVRTSGAVSTDISLLTPDAPLKRQVSLEDAAGTLRTFSLAR